MGEASVRDGGECLGSGLGCGDAGWRVSGRQRSGCQKIWGSGVRVCATPGPAEWIRREKEREEGIYSVLSLVQLGNSD